MLKKESRLISKSDFLKFTSSKVYKNEAFFVKFRQADKKKKFGIIISNKISGLSTVRNKIRRQIKKNIKANLSHIGEGLYLVIARKKCLNYSQKEQTQKLNELLNKIIKNEKESR